MTRKWDQIKRPGNAAMERGYDAALTTATWLAELRQRCGLTQADMAQRLGKTQPAISQIEAETDTHISTVVAYITALGGRLQFTATLPSGEQVQLDQMPPDNVTAHGAELARAI
jgi:DNA-binding XRE family transcriptional regulator